VLGFGQIDPTQQERKLFVTQDDLALRITGLRPGALGLITWVLMVVWLRYANRSHT
jgi:hypothetical protein